MISEKFDCKLVCLIVFLFLPSELIAKNDLKLSANIGFALGYDSNVVVEEVDLSTSLGDSFYRIEVGGDLNYQLTTGSEISAGASLSERQQTDATAFDLSTLLTNVGYSYKVDKTTYSLTYRYASAELAGSDFLTLAQIEPAFSTFLSKKHYVRTAYTYLEKNLTSRPERDASSNKVEIAYFHFLNGLNRYLILSGQIRKEDAETDELDFLGKRLRLAWIQRYKLLSLSQKVTLDLRLRKRTYESAIDPEINAFRDEERLSFEISNETSITDSLISDVGIRYTDNNSNKPSFNFDEAQIQIGLKYSF